MGEFSVSEENHGAGPKNDEMGANKPKAYLDMEEHLQLLDRVTSLLVFEQGVQRLVNKINDPHFKYTPAYARIMAVFLPVKFSSRLNQDNEQEVFVHSFNERLLLWHRVMDPMTPSRVDLNMLIQKKVQQVNGQPTLTFFKV